MNSFASTQNSNTPKNSLEGFHQTGRGMKSIVILVNKVTD